MVKRFSKASKSKKEYIKNVKHYIGEELSSAKENNNSVNELILKEAATDRDKALLFNYLLLMNKINSRILFGVDLGQDEYNELGTFSVSKYSYVNQYQLGSKWYSVRFEDFEKFEEKNLSRFLVITDDFDKFGEIFHNNAIQVSYYVSPGTMSHIDGVTYNKYIKDSSAFYNLLNLYKQKNSFQLFFQFLILIPIGALVLSLFRNIIGFKTFGIFMPILLGLFLNSVGLLYGSVILTFVILLGLFERYILDKFYLLAVPRLSIILTMIVILFIGLSIFHTHFGWFESLSFKAIPVVILAVFIERLSIQLIEEGLQKSIAPILGTISIAVMTYFIYEILFIRVLLFTHPELLISIIGVQVLIGSYHGYRVSEVLRFKDFLKEEENV